MIFARMHCSCTHTYVYSTRTIYSALGHARGEKGTLETRNASSIPHHGAGGMGPPGGRKHAYAHAHKVYIHIYTSYILVIPALIYQYILSIY